MQPRQKKNEVSSLPSIPTCPFPSGLQTNGTGELVGWLPSLANELLKRKKKNYLGLILCAIFGCVMMECKSTGRPDD